MPLSAETSPSRKPVVHPMNKLCPRHGAHPPIQPGPHTPPQNPPVSLIHSLIHSPAGQAPPAPLQALPPARPPPVPPAAAPPACAPPGGPPIASRAAPALPARRASQGSVGRQRGSGGYTQSHTLRLLLLFFLQLLLLLLHKLPPAPLNTTTSLVEHPLISAHLGVAVLAVVDVAVAILEHMGAHGEIGGPPRAGRKAQARAWVGGVSPAGGRRFGFGGGGGADGGPR